LIPQERIVKNILVLRNEKVMLDIHLAQLYEVETRTLKQAVRRSKARFPADFMFMLTAEETARIVREGFIQGKKALGGARPFAFTEMGVYMLAAVLKSEKAVKMNVEIIRTFVTLRKLASDYELLWQAIRKLEEQYDRKLDELYQALKALLKPAEEVIPRRRVGYRSRREQDEE